MTIEFEAAFFLLLIPVCLSDCPSEGPKIDLVGFNFVRFAGNITNAAATAIDARSSFDDAKPDEIDLNQLWATTDLLKAQEKLKEPLGNLPIRPNSQVEETVVVPLFEAAGFVFGVNWKPHPSKAQTMQLETGVKNPMKEFRIPFEGWHIYNSSSVMRQCNGPEDTDCGGISSMSKNRLSSSMRASSGKIDFPEGGSETKYRHDNHKAFYNISSWNEQFPEYPLDQADYTIKFPDLELQFNRQESVAYPIYIFFKDVQRSTLQRLDSSCNEIQKTEEEFYPEIGRDDCATCDAAWPVPNVCLIILVISYVASFVRS